MKSGKLSMLSFQLGPQSTGSVPYRKTRLTRYLAQRQFVHVIVPKMLRNRTPQSQENAAGSDWRTVAEKRRGITGFDALCGGQRQNTEAMRILPALRVEARRGTPLTPLTLTLQLFPFAFSALGLPLSSKMGKCIKK